MLSSQSLIYNFEDRITDQGVALCAQQRRPHRLHTQVAVVLTSYDLGVLAAADLVDVRVKEMERYRSSLQGARHRLLTSAVLHFL
jgi:hypothetical protein